MSCALQLFSTPRVLLCFLGGWFIHPHPPHKTRSPALSNKHFIKTRWPGDEF